MSDLFSGFSIFLSVFIVSEYWRSGCNSRCWTLFALSLELHTLFLLWHSCVRSKRCWDESTIYPKTVYAYGRFYVAYNGPY